MCRSIIKLAHCVIYRFSTVISTQIFTYNSGKRSAAEMFHWSTLTVHKLNNKLKYVVVESIDLPIQDTTYPETTKIPEIAGILSKRGQFLIPDLSVGNR